MFITWIEFGFREILPSDFMVLYLQALWIFMAGILGGTGYVIDEFDWLPIIVAFTLRHVSGIVIVLQSFYWIFMCPFMHVCISNKFQFNSSNKFGGSSQSNLLGTWRDDLDAGNIGFIRCAHFEMYTRRIHLHCVTYILYCGLSQLLEEFWCQYQYWWRP